MDKYIMICRGCQQGFIFPEAVKDAMEHDELDICNKAGDDESEGWYLDWETKL